jgi:hypothetical protein
MWMFRGGMGGCAGVSVLAREGRSDRRWTELRSEELHSSYCSVIETRTRSSTAHVKFMKE